MITITRQFAFQLRNLLRRTGLQSRSARLSAPVLFLASSEGLHIRAVNKSIALEYHQPGPLPPAQCALPVEALVACEAKRNTPVTIEPADAGRVSLRWEDRGMPMAQNFDDCREQILECWPKLPKKFSTNDRTLLTALQAAATVVDQVPTPRLAIHTVQLQGKTGKVAATDCRQALVIRGNFKFPWDDDVLLIPTDAFAFPEFPRDAPVEIGATDTHVFVRIRPWTLYLARVTDRRYPDVEGACPVRAGVRTRVQISPADRDFLASALRRLPAREEPDSPVTLDCNGHFAIRAKELCETSLTELVLSRSTVTGEPMRFNVNRKYLERAIDLGFSELQIVDPHAPCIFEDGHRTYFWMTLGADGALGPSKNCICWDSATTSAADHQNIDNSPHQVPSPPDERLPRMTRTSSASDTSGTSGKNGSKRHAGEHGENSSSNSDPDVTTNGALPAAIASPGTSATSSTSPNGNTATAEQSQGGPPEAGNVDPIAAAETLHDDLRTALASTSRLLQVLRRNRKQHKLVQSTLESLRQLQTVS